MPSTAAFIYHLEDLLHCTVNPAFGVVVRVERGGSATGNEQQLPVNLLCRLTVSCHRPLSDADRGKGDPESCDGGPELRMEFSSVPFVAGALRGRRKGAGASGRRGRRWILELVLTVIIP